MAKKHFPPGHRYSKIFNSHTLRLSYSFMPNIDDIIKQHNNSILMASTGNATESENVMCNCRVKEDCPLDGQCLTPCTTYSATVTVRPDNVEHIYYGLSEPPFKKRYTGHSHSFRNEELRSSTELSKFVWDLKNGGVDYSIKWKIESKCHPYRNGSRRCNLCLTEKLIIARSKHPRMINKRSELMSKCRHRNKFLLQSVGD